MAINNGAIDYTTINSVQEESAHRHSLSHQDYTCANNFRHHKNGRQTDLHEEILEIQTG